MTQIVLKPFKYAFYYKINDLMMPIYAGEERDCLRRETNFQMWLAPGILQDRNMSSERPI